VREQRLRQVPEVLLDGARDGLALPHFGIAQLERAVAGLRIQALVQQLLHFGQDPADPIEPLIRESSRLKLYQAILEKGERLAVQVLFDAVGPEKSEGYSLTHMLLKRW
jgi:hypothetical protein